MKLPRFLRNVLAGVVTRLVVGYIDHRIESTKRRIRNEERVLRERIAELLCIPKEKVSVRFLPYQDGSILPAVELRMGISQTQLHRMTDFLDAMTPIRQNVRRPTPAVN